MNFAMSVAGIAGIVSLALTFRFFAKYTASYPGEAGGAASTQMFAFFSLIGGVVGVGLTYVLYVLVRHLIEGPWAVAMAGIGALFVIIATYRAAAARRKAVN
ncbi:MAG TPA: hypothetical protein VFH06_03710 [Candidatus Saccharimonadales bacterium]|nr:hypothetical protein [Candidatus Saccharimonadales bacterium]